MTYFTAAATPDFDVTVFEQNVIVNGVEYVPKTRHEDLAKKHEALVATWVAIHRLLDDQSHVGG